MKAVAVLPIAVFLACSQPTHTATAQPPAATQQILDRYTADIWPAISAYNAEQNQGGPAYLALGAVVDPVIKDPTGPNGLAPLMAAVRKLGRQGTYDPATNTSHSNDGLHLGDVAITATSGAAATLLVCYSYTHSWYVDVADTQEEQETSQATVELTARDNTWYLHSITDDHIVPGCGSAN